MSYYVYLVYAHNRKVSEKDNVRHLLVLRTDTIQKARKIPSLALNSYLDDLQASHDGFYGEVNSVPCSPSDWEPGLIPGTWNLWLNIDPKYFEEANGANNPFGVLVGASIEEK